MAILGVEEGTAIESGGRYPRRKSQIARYGVVEINSVKKEWRTVPISRLAGTGPFFLHGYRGPRGKRKERTGGRFRERAAPHDRFSAVVGRASRSSLSLPAHRPDRF